MVADIKFGRESLAKAFRQSEGRENGAPAFAWDIMLDIGDLSASQYPPTDHDGRVVVRQYRALDKHYREDVYNLPGNHDAPYYDHGPGSWFRKWVDPLGENSKHSGVDPARRPFPITGTWERYSFVAGNVLFLMMSDRNDLPNPVGRGHSSDHAKGGFPAGAVTRETFNWWKEQVLANQDKIIISAHHHMLRDTTTRSGYGEGEGFHGRSGGVEGSSYLYFIVEDEDPATFRYTSDAHVFEEFLALYQKEHGKPAIDFWIGGHSHVMHPDQVFAGKRITETNWGVTFINASALTLRHSGGVPSSRLLTFTDGSDQVELQVYLHEQSHRGDPQGWYAPASKTVKLRLPFQAPPPLDRPPKLVPPEQAYEHDGPAEVSPVFVGGELRLTGSPQWKAKAGNDGSLQIENPDQRVNVGAIPMDDWQDLTVVARIRTTRKSEAMRVVSKGRIGQKGNFMLWFNSWRGWAFSVFDDRLKRWRVAHWQSTAINDGQWHQLVGVVDSQSRRILLYVDGALRGEAEWTATDLDDSDRTDLVVGSDSASRERGQVFNGGIDEVVIHRRALTGEAIRALAESQE